MPRLTFAAGPLAAGVTVYGVSVDAAVAAAPVILILSVLHLIWLGSYAGPRP
jgi:hypothetical protein